MAIYKNIFVNFTGIKKLRVKISRKDIIYTRLCEKNQLLNMSFAEAGVYTMMKFPPKNAGAREKKIQKQNYNYFIQTMAEMIKKYMLDMEE